MKATARREVLALILAGGRGQRMGALCQVRPKPCLPFAGSHRVIDFVLSNCAHSQMSQVAVLADYQRMILAPYLLDWHKSTYFWNSIDVLTPKEGSYSGTADAVYQNLDYLRRSDADTVLVLAGDHVYSMDYRQMLDFHRRSGADVTVATVAVPLDQAHRFGVVETDPAGRIIDFVEKPRAPQSNLASMGIFAFSREALYRQLKADAGRSHSTHDFGYSIIPEMARQNRACAYTFNGYWRDIGTVEAYYQANMEFARGFRSASGDAQWPVLAEKTAVPGTSVAGQGRIINSLVGPGCIIKGHIENSILSAGVTVEERAVVRESVLMANAVVGEHSVVEGCILDENVSVGRFCWVGFGLGSQNSNRVTVLGRDVLVPPFTAIDRNCTIGPAGFADRALRSGAVLSPVPCLTSVSNAECEAIKVAQNMEGGWKR